MAVGYIGFLNFLGIKKLNFLGSEAKMFKGKAFLCVLLEVEKTKS